MIHLIGTYCEIGVLRPWPKLHIVVTTDAHVLSQVYTMSQEK